MKIIRYKVLVAEINHGTEAQPDIEQLFAERERGCTEDTLESASAIAQAEAYGGEYTIEDVEETAIPSQLDIIEAQVTYTAMMTDTLLEV